MTPAEIAAIMVRLDHQDEAIGEIKTTVHEILGHAQYTNGQVNDLKQWRAIQEALAQKVADERRDRSAFEAWLFPALIGSGATVIAAVLTVVLTTVF